MSQVKDIQQLEKMVICKKEEQRAKIQEHAKERYDHQVKTHDEARVKLENEISRLEQRERELIDRLKQTQTHHQLYVDDIDRIIRNEEPRTLVVNDAERPRTSQNRLK